MNDTEKELKETQIQLDKAYERIRQLEKELEDNHERIRLLEIINNGVYRGEVK